MKRQKTSYPGVFFRETKRIGGKGLEKVFYIIFKKDGKTLEEKAGRQYSDDMTAARASRIRAERIEGKRLSRKELREQKKAEAVKGTIARLWELYKENRVEGKSLKTDESRYRIYIEPLLGNKEPKNIILLDIDRLRHKYLKGKSPQTVKHVYTLIDRIINFGANRNLCEPLSFKIQKPRVNYGKTEDLTPEQLQNLLKAIDEDTHEQAGAMMLTALYSGMRRGEMFKLTWADVDYQRGFIHIRDPKGGQDQKIPLNDAARDLLENHIRTGSAFVFPGRGGNQLVDINKQVNEIKKKADLPKDFRPLHGLRHVYASMLASSGKVDMYVLQKLLTHKDGRMTQRYAHLRDEALKKAANVAGSIIKQAMKDKKLETSNG